MRTLMFSIVRDDAPCLGRRIRRVLVRDSLLLNQSVRVKSLTSTPGSRLPASERHS